jgi:MoxR-like ATPase
MNAYLGLFHLLLQCWSRRFNFGTDRWRKHTEGASVKLKFLVLILLFVPILAVSAESVQHRVFLRHSSNSHPVFVEIGEKPGFLRVLSGVKGSDQAVLFDGSAQSLAMPSSNGINQETIKALTDAGFYFFDVDSNAPKSADLFVLVSNGAIYAYEGQANRNFLVAPIPVDESVDVKYMRVSQLWIDWKKPGSIVYSYEYRTSLPPDQQEFTKAASFVFQAPVDNGHGAHKFLADSFSRDISLVSKETELYVNFKPAGQTNYRVVRIPDLVTSAPSNDFSRKTLSTSRALAVVPKSQPQSQPPAANDYKGHIKDFSNRLKEQVLGQPEGVDLLLDIEKQNILNNNVRLTPEVGMFIGLPGTGKDTLVEAYVRTRMVTILKDNSDSLDAHLYRMPIVKEKGDVWAVTGSGTGYVGSGKISALNRFLVLHSGGRYEIKKTEGTSPEEYVVENRAWRPGQVREGYFGPQDGVLYINEFHDWSRELKNTLLKELLEKGYSTIGNPGPGINRIQVPITVLMASNDGIGLITARDRDGNRVGAPLSEEQLLERWRIYARDKAALKNEIAQPGPANPIGGTSEEVLSRIPNSRLLLLRPLPYATVIKITKMKLEQLRAKFAGKKAMGFPSVNLEFSPKLEKFMASYDQLAEEGARAVDDKVKSLLEKTLTDAVFSGRLEYQDGDTMKIGVRKNNDGTFSLMIGPKPFLIGYTEKNRDQQEITDERIDELSDLEAKLNARVKGVEHIVAALARDIRRSANVEKKDHVDKETKTADVYAFFGTSSTGKTELAVALHQVLFKTDSKPIVIDFSQIQTIRDLKEKILGSRDGLNKSIASDFMDAYDRSNGKLVLVLDEVSNANPEVLKALYDILREPVVRTFSDRKSRPMGQVRIVMTGNAGEEWYAGIPREAPEVEQLEAARQIYEKSVGDEGFIRRFLMARFSEAFLNRVGTHRVFFFGPHTARNTRELIQLKLVKAMDEFSELRAGRRSWKMKFASQEEYLKTIEAIEDYGFKLWEQGASITNFVNQALVAEIHDKLLIEKVPTGTEVVITKAADKKLKDGTSVGFTLTLPKTGQSFSVEVRGKPTIAKMKKNADEIVWTAFHEAGHEIVNKVLLGDRMESRGISILPGVVEINGRWIAYEGIARREQIETIAPTREVVMARIAVLLAGEAGELLSTKGARHSAGKSNDIERATTLARTAILQWGLSEKWGVTAPDSASVNQFILGLSNAKKNLLEKEVRAMLDEGRTLAKQVLVANYDSLLNPMASHLAEKGEISGRVLERFYRQRMNLIVHPSQAELVAERLRDFDAKTKLEAPPKSARDFEFYSFAMQPKKVADPDVIRESQRAKELAEVDLSPGLKLVKTAEIEPVAKPKGASGPMSLAIEPASGGRCELLFR